MFQVPTKLDLEQRLAAGRFGTLVRIRLRDTFKSMRAPLRLIRIGMISAFTERKHSYRTLLCIHPYLLPSAHPSMNAYANDETSRYILF